MISSRTHRPVARVVMDGRDVTTNWQSVLESISVTDEAGLIADTCEFAFDNREGFTAPPLGAEIKIWIGYEPAPTYMGSYTLDSWTKTFNPRRLSISGKAVDFTSAIKSPKLRSHHAMTVKEIVEKIASGHQLAAIVDPAIGSRPIAHIDQQHESDMAFLTRLAKRNGATFKLGDGQIIFAAKGSPLAPSGKDKTPITIGYTDVTECSVQRSRRGEFDSASAHYMDHVAGKRLTAIAGTGTKRHRDRRLYGNKSEAQAAAAGNLGDFTRGQLTATVEMPGNPALFAEALVTLKGFDSDADGDYFAKSVTHTYGGDGYIMSLTLEADGAADDEDTSETSGDN
jgi:phage protein D